MMRAREDSDEIQLRTLYDGADLPKLLHERVLVEDGKIVGHAGIRMVPEAVLTLGKGHPAAKNALAEIVPRGTIGVVERHGLQADIRPRRTED